VNQHRWRDHRSLLKPLRFLLVLFVGRTLPCRNFIKGAPLQSCMSQLWSEVLTLSSALGRGSFSNNITIYFRADVSALLRGRNLSVIYVLNPVLRGFFRFEKPFHSGV